MPAAGVAAFLQFLIERPPTTWMAVPPEWSILLCRRAMRLFRAGTRRRASARRTSPHASPHPAGTHVRAVVFEFEIGACRIRRIPRAVWRLVARGAGLARSDHCLRRWPATSRRRGSNSATLLLSASAKSSQPYAGTLFETVRLHDDAFPEVSHAEMPEKQRFANARFPSQHHRCGGRAESVLQLRRFRPAASKSLSRHASVSRLLAQ